MGSFRWLADNWFTLLQSAGIVGSLLFTGLSLRADIRARRATNLISVTEHHREIWTELYSRPELARVLSARPELKKRPVTPAEELFVKMLVLHLYSSYQARREGVFNWPERLKADIQDFFSLPIPRTVWQRLKPMQDEDFVKFVETALKSA